MAELERIERLLLALVQEVRDLRAESRNLQAGQMKILGVLQDIEGDLEPATTYPASTGASISVT
jgi:hypothetical protein